MKLQLLDELIALGHQEVRTTDCIVAVKANPSSWDLERAQKIFSKTNQYPMKMTEVTSLETFSASELKTPFHLEFAKIQNENLFALKMSHILGDAISMIQFLKVAMGEEIKTGPLFLKEFPSKKDTPYRKMLNSRLWPARRKIGRQRKFLRETFYHENVNPIHLNDFFMLSLLDVLPYQRKAIWVPVNVRKNFWEGFGNGLSRLRVYPPAGNTQEEKLSHIRRQKQEALKNGEVALPPKGFDLGNRHQKMLYEIWVKRPWADWGTLSFSHITNSQGFLNSFQETWGISNLMPAHNGALFAVTQDQKTDFTLTYDSQAVSDEEAQFLMGSFLSRLKAK